MTQLTVSRRQDFFLHLTGYIAVVAVAVTGLNTLHQKGQAWGMAAGLLLLFGMLLARLPKPRGSAWRPHLYLAVQTGLILGLIGIEHSAWSAFTILFFVLSAQAMLILPLRLGTLWIVIFLLVTGSVSAYAEGWQGGLTMLGPHGGGYFFFSAFGYALSQAEEARKKSQTLLEELQTAHRQLQEYSAKAEGLAVAEERNRLAREMHDTLGHRLTVAAVQLEGAQRLIPSDPERASGMVGTVRDQVREALSELRRTVATLRAPMETDLSLPNALTRLATGFEAATDLTVHLMLPDEMPPLPDAHRLALYRTAQETLTNTQRHAQAQDVWLQLTWQDGTVALLIGDNGVGLPDGAAQTGFGLLGLRERAAQLNGEFILEARPGGGTQLSFRLPLPQELTGLGARGANR